MRGGSDLKSEGVESNDDEDGRGRAQKVTDEEEGLRYVSFRKGLVLSIRNRSYFQGKIRINRFSTNGTYLQLKIGYEKDIDNSMCSSKNPS